MGFRGPSIGCRGRQGMSEQHAGPTVRARGISFENRIAISALVTAIVVLLTASAMFILEQWQAERRDLKHQQATLVQMMSVSVAPLAATGDAASVQHVLSILATAPSVRSAE